MGVRDRAMDVGVYRWVGKASQGDGGRRIMGLGLEKQTIGMWDYPSQLQRDTM